MKTLTLAIILGQLVATIALGNSVEDTKCDLRLIGGRAPVEMLQDNLYSNTLVAKNGKFEGKVIFQANGLIRAIVSDSESDGYYAEVSGLQISESKVMPQNLVSLKLQGSGVAHIACYRK